MGEMVCLCFSEVKGSINWGMIVEISGHVYLENFSC